jgi:hypothetical protein
MTADFANEAQLALSLFAPLPVEPTAEVLRCGSRARARRGRGELLFAHRHLPARPPAVAEDHTWAAMIDLAEEAARSDQPTVAVLDLRRRRYSGVMGHGSLMLDSRGCRAFSSGDHATSPSFSLPYARAAAPSLRSLAPGTSRTPTTPWITTVASTATTRSTTPAAGAPSRSSHASRSRYSTSAATRPSCPRTLTTCALGYVTRSLAGGETQGATDSVGR